MQHYTFDDNLGGKINVPILNNNNNNNNNSNNNNNNKDCYCRGG